MHKQCCGQNVLCCCADELPWGSVGDSLAAGQDPFLRTPLAGAGTRLQIDVPLQHAPPQFQACPLIMSFTDKKYSLKLLMEVSLASSTVCKP